MIFNGKLSEPALIVIGIAAGYICAVILQSIIKRLKKVENFAAEKSEILLSRGTVSNAIPKDGVGAVSILLSTILQNGIRIPIIIHAIHIVLNIEPPLI